MPERSGPSRLCVRGGTVVDERGERRADVLVEDGIVVAVEEAIEVPAGTRVLDASGCAVSPGLVDLHAHLREPGREDAETVETGARAAALGGYSAILAMPNTEPATDSAAAVRTLLALGAGACTEVAVAGAITLGRAGERLAPLAEMAELGVRLFTDDGRGVQHAGLMRRALEYARPLGVVLAEHCEDEELAAGGFMHEGEWSSRLGIPGQPALAEEAMVARDIALVRLTGSPLHFLHLSTARSVALVRAARGEGLPVTAEVTPHHLSLTDAEVASYDPVFKVNPPLRTAQDVLGVRAGLLDGTIDAVATDHAPHRSDTKDEPFDSAPPGMVGLETALAVAYGALCLTGDGAASGLGSWSVPDPDGAERSPATLTQLFAWLSWKPARIAGLDARSGQGGPIAPGSIAHLCAFDLSARWKVDPSRSASRSRNTPFAGRELVGRVRHTVVRGEAVVVDGEAQR
ncbi:MAG: dihydroorotase, multifunctional complex type [Acidimicrobiaceae bacterium]|nr:dihydroorotase, multifunctional complex type [Acidimicrobiaceae bacterium]